MFREILKMLFCSHHSADFVDDLNTPKSAYIDDLNTPKSAYVDNWNTSKGADVVDDLHSLQECDLAVHRADGVYVDVVDVDVHTMTRRAIQRLKWGGGGWMWRHPLSSRSACSSS